MGSHAAAIVLSLAGLSPVVRAPTPRGELTHHSYQSQAIGGTQELHVWSLWRRNFADMTQRVFQEPTK